MGSLTNLLRVRASEDVGESKISVDGTHMGELARESRLSISGIVDFIKKMKLRNHPIVVVSFIRSNHFGFHAAARVIPVWIPR